jgi:transcription elongation factor GreA
MIAELRTRLGYELDRVSKQLEARVSTYSLTSPGQEAAEDPARREMRHILQRRVRLLGQIVAGLEFVDPASISADRAGYGSVVSLRDVATGAEYSYTLMSGDFIDVDEGQVSLASPIGSAVTGRGIGDRVGVTTPRGQREYEIIDLVSLPVKLGIVKSSEDTTAVHMA